MGKNKVIIVDDDASLLELLVSAFQAKGFEVHGINNGTEALDYLLEEKNIETACLIILDRILPDMEGLEILKKFQEKFSGRVPVLILSLLSSEKDVLAGFKEGAIDYVTKPFNLSILMQKALSLIKK